MDSTGIERLKEFQLHLDALSKKLTLNMKPLELQTAQWPTVDKSLLNNAIYYLAVINKAGILNVSPDERCLESSSGGDKEPKNVEQDHRE